MFPIHTHSKRVLPTSAVVALDLVIVEVVENHPLGSGDAGKTGSLDNGQHHGHWGDAVGTGDVTAVDGECGEGVECRVLVHVDPDGSLDVDGGAIRLKVPAIQIAGDLEVIGRSVGGDVSLACNVRVDVLGHVV